MSLVTLVRLFAPRPVDQEIAVHKEGRSRQALVIVEVMAALPLTFFALAAWLHDFYLAAGLAMVLVLVAPGLIARTVEASLKGMGVPLIYRARVSGWIVVLLLAGLIGSSYIALKPFEVAPPR